MGEGEEKGLFLGKNEGEKGGEGKRENRGKRTWQGRFWKSGNSEEKSTNMVKYNIQNISMVFFKSPAYKLNKPFPNSRIKKKSGRIT